MPIKSIDAQKAYTALWLDPDAVGAALFIVALDSYGQELFSLEPVVIREELESGFKVENIPQVNIDKLMGIWMALSTDMVHTDPSTFIHVCNALSGTAVDIANFDPADPYEIAWGLVELTFMDGSTANRLSSDVKRYIGETCKAFGLYRPPQVLSSVADFGGEDYMSNSESHAVTSEDMQGMTQRQSEYSTDISDYLSRRTNKLMVTLHSLPLLNKDKESWNKFVEAFAKRMVSANASS